MRGIDFWATIELQTCIKILKKISVDFSLKFFSFFSWSLGRRKASKMLPFITNMTVKTFSVAHLVQGKSVRVLFMTKKLIFWATFELQTCTKIFKKISVDFSLQFFFFIFFLVAG